MSSGSADEEEYENDDHQAQQRVPEEEEEASPSGELRLRYLPQQAQFYYEIRRSNVYQGARIGGHDHEQTHDQQMTCGRAIDSHAHEN